MDQGIVLIDVRMHEGCEDLFPRKAHESDAGFDLSAREDAIIPPGVTCLIATGVYLGLPEGWEAQIRPRSGMSLRTAIILPNAPGTIDAGYRNEINIILRNTGHEDFAITRGTRIAQMVIKQVPQVYLQLVTELTDTPRGLKGFGSSGK